jgi:signal transduction histidine kinase
VRVTGLPRDSEPAQRRRLWLGLRPRLLGALVLTAIVTLATAALTLLAPLQSALRGDSKALAISDINGAKTPFGILPVDRDGFPAHRKLERAADRLSRASDGGTVAVWTADLHRLYDTDRDASPEPPPHAVRVALATPKTTQSHLSGNLLIVAARYTGQPYGQPRRGGRVFVIALRKTLDFVGSANDVVRTAFLDAALVGLGVALVLGIALSSRLLRRLRLLRDASRTLDERELSTLVVPKETVTDEIGELAQSFATMHARLRQQEDARRAFVATASHELRTPLASLDGMLELLADDLAHEPIDLADARERVTRAQAQSRRLAGLAKDLLDLSRIDARLELRSEPVELGETARAVTAEFDLRAREREVAVVLDQIGERAWAQADPGSVAQIVRILLDNALAAAPPHSMVEVRVGNGSGPPTIEVADTGPGVRADERTLIFERFMRGSERGSEGGFGLGLAIGSELAERMGGRLELTDEAPGATFRLTLPEVSA